MGFAGVGGLTGDFCFATGEALLVERGVAGAFAGSTTDSILSMSDEGIDDIGNSDF